MALTPTDIFQKMYDHDAFSKWLGIELIDIKVGYCKLKMMIRPEMLNGFGSAHGGITYSFADSAFAFASNSHGNKSVSIETSISHTEPLKSGDEIFAEAVEVTLSNKLARYKIQVTTKEGLVVALFNGTVFRTGKPF